MRPRRPGALVAGAGVALLTGATVLGFAGVFTVYTFIQPILTRISGFGEAAVSPILLQVQARRGYVGVGLWVIRQKLNLGPTAIAVSALSSTLKLPSSAPSRRIRRSSFS